MPPNYSTQAAIVRICSSCAATVDRRNCHKNRHSQYICRRCQAAGTKFTNARRGRYFARRRFFLKWTLSLLFLGTVLAGLVGPAIWLDILTLDSFSGPGAHSKVPIDTQGGVLLNTEIRARLIEGSGQAGAPSSAGNR